MYDRATDFLEAYPVASKSMDDTIESFQSWAGPMVKIESFYADNAPELKAAAKKLRWRMPTSTPGVPPSNGLIERMVRKVSTAAKTNRSQSGLHKTWWPHAMRHGTFSRNTGMVDGDSAYNKRHNGAGHCAAKRIPFGCFVDYLPTPSAKDTVRAK